MKINLAGKTVSADNADYEVVFCGSDAACREDAEALALAGFGRADVVDMPERRRLYVKIDDPSKDNYNEMRFAAAKAVKALADHNVKSVFVRLPQPACGCVEQTGCAFAEGLILSAYRFDKYKSEKSPYPVEEVLVAAPDGQEDAVAKGLSDGSVLADAVNYTRDITNEPPQVYTPESMASDAGKLAESYSTVTCEVFGPEYLKSENMNAFLAVNQSSPHEPRLIHLAYVPKAASADKSGTSGAFGASDASNSTDASGSAGAQAGSAPRKYAFVGKGLTYDSGGLTLKSRTGMSDMKSDKAGAATVMGIIKAAAELELPFEIHGVLGCTENMIGADAYKPDDVIVSRAGVTIEVNNTDAEGRLVLADCLSWACDKIAPDEIIDLATLTGACVNALGAYTTGVLGCDFDRMMGFKRLAEKSGELYSVLESNKYIARLINSKVADVKNSAPGKPGGAQIAAVFLSKFLPEKYRDKWIHLDIAGPAFGSEEWGCNHAGATGEGLRGCMYYMMLKKE